VPVRADPEPAGGDAVIGHRERPAFAGFRRWFEDDSEAVVLVLGADGRASRRYPGDRHPLTGRGRGEVEREVGQGVPEEPEVDPGFARDLVGVIAEGQPEDVMEHIDTRLARIGVGGAGGCE
jgi:hypothetical protein